jgi:hypothetical protein
VEVLVDIELRLVLQAAEALRNQQYRPYEALTTPLQLAALVQVLFLALLLHLVVVLVAAQ